MLGKFHSNSSLSSNNLLKRKQLLLHCTLNLLLIRPESRERCKNTPVTSASGAPRRKHTTNTDVLEVIYHEQNLAMNDLLCRIHIYQPKSPCHFKHCEYMRLLFLCQRIWFLCMTQTREANISATSAAKMTTSPDMTTHSGAKARTKRAKRQRNHFMRLCFCTF